MESASQASACSASTRMHPNARSTSSTDGQSDLFSPPTQSQPLPSHGCCRLNEQSCAATRLYGEGSHIGALHLEAELLAMAKQLQQCKEEDKQLAMRRLTALANHIPVSLHEGSSVVEGLEQLQQRVTQSLEKIEEEILRVLRRSLRRRMASMLEELRARADKQVEELERNRIRNLRYQPVQQAPEGSSSQNTQEPHEVTEEAPRVGPPPQPLQAKLEEISAYEIVEAKVLSILRKSFDDRFGPSVRECETSTETINVPKPNNQEPEPTCCYSFKAIAAWSSEQALRSWVEFSHVIEEKRVLLEQELDHARQIQAKIIASEKQSMMHLHAQQVLGQKRLSDIHKQRREIKAAREAKAKMILRDAHQAVKECVRTVSTNLNGIHLCLPLDARTRYPLPCREERPSARVKQLYEYVEALLEEWEGALEDVKSTRANLEYELSVYGGEHSGNDREMEDISAAFQGL